MRTSEYVTGTPLASDYDYRAYPFGRKLKGMIMRYSISCKWLCVMALPVFCGCSGSSSPSTGGAGGSQSNGGSPNGGDTSSNGGSSSTSDQGGSSAQTGGSIAIATGGSIAATTGGAAAGGAAAGGRLGTGGAQATGGLPLTGGSAAKGGASSTGGTKSTGGVAATGGSIATGGIASSTGGSNGTCIESTCGSHKFACWPMPTPVSEGLPNPQSYTDLGNGAVRDNITCLVWEKSNVATQGDWQANFDRCAALGTSNWAGFSDWRLPTRVEMASIVDVTRGNKGFASIFTINGGSFATGSYWYETIMGINNANLAWTYGGNGLTSNAMPLTTATQVSRCVRGNGTGEAPNVLAVQPANHYTIIGAAPTGEVQDNYTGLIWQQGFSPTTVAFADAPAYCASLTLNGHTGWRVPALNELASSVDEALVGSAIDPKAFPGNPNGCKDPKYWFWAAEPSGANAWGLSYCDGFTGTNVGAAAGVWDYFPTANVRCVR